MPRITSGFLYIRRTDGRASMRPGRNAPDNLLISEPIYHVVPSFNEAGAKCPG